MNFFDNLLARAHRWAQRADRRLSEPVLKKPEPEPPKDCGGCLQPLGEPDDQETGFFVEAGVTYHGGACYLATPTMIRRMRIARFEHGLPGLAGDPRG
jgi:hypothetical protein